MIERQEPGYIDHQLIFCTERGEPLMGDAVAHGFHRLLNRAGIPPVRFHDLRHTAATLLLSLAKPLPEIADMLGHSDTSDTGRVCAHVTPPMRRATAIELGELLTERTAS